MLSLCMPILLLNSFLKYLGVCILYSQYRANPYYTELGNLTYYLLQTASPQWGTALLGALMKRTHGNRNHQDR